MSDRALLIEILDFIDKIRINEVMRFDKEYFLSVLGRIANKTDEIRTRMATAQPICQYEFPKYYCELELYDGGCSHCTDKLECFKPKKKEEQKDGN